VNRGWHALDGAVSRHQRLLRSDAFDAGMKIRPDEAFAAQIGEGNGVLDDDWREQNAQVGSWEVSV
jgi:hypothetical protein